jgi:hypothetical protein
MVETIPLPAKMALPKIHRSLHSSGDSGDSGGILTLLCHVLICTEIDHRPAFSLPTVLFSIFKGPEIAKEEKADNQGYPEGEAAKGEGCPEGGSITHL